MNLFIKTPGSSGDNISLHSPYRARHVRDHYRAAASCSINAGQVIEVRLPDIEGKDIVTRRQSAELARSLR